MPAAGYVNPLLAGNATFRPGSGGSHGVGNSEKLPGMSPNIRSRKGYVVERYSSPNSDWTSKVEDGSSSDEEINMIALCGDAPAASVKPLGLSQSCHDDRGAQVGAGEGGELEDQDLETPPLTTSGMNSPTRLGVQGDLFNPTLSAGNGDSSGLSLLSVEGVIREKQ